MMMPSCSFSTWWCRNDAGGAAGDAPEAQLQVVAGDDPAAEARAVGVVELVVVEEVAVCVVEVWHVGASGSSIER